MTDIAFFGLGIMGRGMVHNLLKAGHLVIGWNRSARDLPHEVGDHGNFELAESIAQAAAVTDTLMLCLTGPDAQREVILSPDGLLHAVRRGATVIDATTTDPRLTRELAEAFRARGIDYLDCPVFGSKNEAWDGRLDIVCGGPRRAFERVRPLLEPLAATVHYMGESGAGAAMKLVGNLFVAAQLSSLGEGLSMARKAGLEPDAVMRVLDVTDYSSPLIRGVGRNSFAGNYEPFFYLKHMLKDARLIEDFARQLAVPVPATATVAELLQAAVNAGYGELNASALHKLLFKLSGVEA